MPRRDEARLIRAYHLIGIVGLGVAAVYKANPEAGTVLGIVFAICTVFVILFHFFGTPPGSSSSW